MRLIARFFISFATALLLCASVFAQNSVEDVQALAERILPRQSRNIDFVQVESEEDFYSLETLGKKLVISGNNANSMAVGLGNYLRDWCNINVSWFARDAVKEPRTLPVVSEKVSRNALVGYRFFLNYCTYGYTLCWWKWKDWERFIDWMALHGVTLALANTGQEAVWQKVWMQFGLTEQQTREYFTGPAFLPWHRMSNIDFWDGPLPQSWIDSQAELQKKIVDRELSLGINPILTAFNGHVPAALKAIYPDADIKPLSDWGLFEQKQGETRCRCSYLSPSDPLYNAIQKAFLKEQREMYGRDCHIYGIDPFNEVDPPCWDADFLEEAGRNTYETLAENDPDAIWLQMGWLFYHDKRWTPDLVKAYIGSIPKGKLVMIDYYCEKAEVYRTTDSFFGQDFIWSYLGNFGGNTMISGDIKDVSFKLDRAYVEAGEGMKGVGCTLEGLGVDSPLYEYVLDRAWEKTKSDELWIKKLADSHIGFEDEQTRRAWLTMYEHCQKQLAGDRGMTATCRPNMAGWNNWRNRGCNYDNHYLLEAWGYLCSAGKSKSAAYRFDCVNIGRQCLENYFSDLYQELLAAYKNKNIDVFHSVAGRMLGVLDDLEKLCATDSYFLMGKWIKDARNHGTSKKEKNYLERDARLLLTCWAYRGSNLRDYANRCWNGMISTYYKPRWASFINMLSDSLRDGTAANYQDWEGWSKSFEWKWATGEWIDTPGYDEEHICGAFKSRKGRFISRPKGNPVKTSKALYEKYRVEILNSTGTSGMSEAYGPNKAEGI
jgi:alpha-N-acetylglucosaminidase